MPSEPNSITPSTLAASQPRSSIAEDATQGVAEVILASIPIAGPALQTSFSTAANIVATRQNEKWLSNLAATVDSIANRVHLTVEEVVQNPLFYETLVRSTRAAQATTSKAKLEALQNVVTNSGDWAPSPGVVQQTCLRLVADLDPEHLSLLSCLADARVWAARHPSLAGRQELLISDVLPLIFVLDSDDAAHWMGRTFLGDLQQRHLVSDSPGLGYDLYSNIPFNGVVTPLATALLEMIANPTKPM
jgi:hypothetical protein